MKTSIPKTTAALMPAALSLLALATLAGQANAEVADLTPSGFLIRHEIVVDQTPEQAYKTLVNIGGWWNPAHTYSGNARNMSIDAKPGGCFCEQLPNGGVQHLAVVFAKPGQLLRMAGALGPLQGSGVAGSMSWQISANPGATPDKPSSKLVMTYSVGGYMQGGFEKIAPAVNGVLGEQVGRLKNFANTGKPD
ncbi:hypothetical protein [Undibacterium terreum]|nr:hypothetical protein [Undibacterium terreum]